MQINLYKILPAKLQIYIPKVYMKAYQYKKHPGLLFANWTVSAAEYPADARSMLV